ncbi:MAG: DMT family transporter [Rhodospirillales bacterium]|nr:DMT family transporter [Rhodospirillales bacterium]
MSRYIIALPPVIRAALWMSATIASFLLMMVSARELVHTISTFEILAFRSSFALIVLLPIILRTGPARMATRRIGLHVTRNIFHFGGQVGWIIGITLLPLTEVTALEFSMPLWTAVLAVIILKEDLNRHRAIAMALGFAGILIILRPGVGVFSPAALVVLAGTFGYAVSNIAGKQLTRTDNALQIVFYMQVVQLPMALIPALFNWTQPGWSDAPWLVFMGLTALSAHYCLTRAFMLVDVTVILPIDFLRLPCMGVIAWFAYAERLDPMVLVGAAIIFGGNYYSVREEARKPKQESGT